ncbi:EamA family transporter [Candidatus Woesebacteria bacterium]|nr:MAG: EamA family transporter [Candidatus Woesebacteria bacterium]
MPWQIYLIISIILISCNGIFHRSLLKDDNSSPQAQTVAFLGLGGTVAVIIAIIQGKLNLLFSPNLTVNFLLLALLFTPAYLLKYRAYQLIGASEVVMFSVTARLWNVIGANMFLNEVLTLKILLGTSLIIFGVMLTRFEKRKLVINKGIIFVLISSFLFGIGEINGFHILDSYDSTNYLIYSEFIPVVALLILQPKTVRKLKYYFRKEKAIKILLLSLCDAFGMLTLYLAYQTGGNVSLIGPLRATSIIITTIIAFIILKERNNITNKLIGSVIAVLGVALLL